MSKSGGAVALAFALALGGGSACKEKTSKPKVFECYRTGNGIGVNWRECATELSDCEARGCFERDQAFCFPYVITSLRSDRPDKRAVVCTPTEKECTEWHQDRMNVPNHPLGTCGVLRPDEYPDHPVATE